MGSRATKRNSPIMIDNDPDNVPEGNQRRIEFLLVISQLPKISTNDLPALRKRFYDYINLCVKYNMKVGNMAAYAAMGVDRDTVNCWESGKRRSSQKEYQEFAREIKRVSVACRTAMAGLPPAIPGRQPLCAMAGKTQKAAPRTVKICSGAVNGSFCVCS